MNKAVYMDHMVGYRGVYSCGGHRNIHSYSHKEDISCLYTAPWCGAHKAVGTFGKDMLCAFYLDNIQYNFQYIVDHTVT